jgi:cell division septation protein DedD
MEREFSMLSNITFKHRLIGGIFLLSLAVIIIPALFDTPRVDDLSSAESPEAPLQAAWEELDKIEYQFSELAQTEVKPEPELTRQTTTETLSSAPQIIEDPAQEIAAVSPDVIVDHSRSSSPSPSPVPSRGPQHPITSPEPKKPQPQVISTAAPIVQETAVVAATERLIAAEGWAVQLGAFSKKTNAQALANRLQAKGYEVYLEEIASSKLTRVLVGTKADKQQAAELLTELDKNMQLKGILVKYSPQS